MCCQPSNLFVKISRIYAVTIYRPQIFNLLNYEHEKAFSSLLKLPHVSIVDTYAEQVKELIVSRLKANTSQSVIEEQVEDFINKRRPIDKQGVWLYYSWRNTLVHLLEENDFIELRTNRNREKIYKEKQYSLGDKTVCIIGLSVGRSIATTIASERIAGEIRLADFDSIDLSNLNRIKCSLASLGENKAVSAAREIAEIDPFMRVKCWTNGINSENIKDFLSGDSTADLLIEECDDFKIKLIARKTARSLGIPVLTETNDNCIVDVERFDLNRELDIYHRLITNQEIDDFLNDKRGSSNRDILLKLFDATMLSSRMQESFKKIGEELVSWPQLASEVTYGAGVVVGIAREIFLNRSSFTGRVSHKMPHI